MYRNMVLSMAGLMVALGAVLVIETWRRQASASGSSSALLFIAAGALRIWMLRRRPR